ncbi:MAG: GlsB/YeaQ/YmgE family stress response membrane protein [Saprospiraceae bacterium]|nr:GlsB/YeaQ/YmgE family stress response membrane protein [Saprospiraceae bacterium]
MGLIYWLLIGLAAGALAKALTPQKEKGGWISSIIVGIIGAVVGGWLAGILGISASLGLGIVGSIIVATGGAFLVLFIYHKYLADKLNLPL